MLLINFCQNVLQIFLSSFRQNANAKISTTTCYQDKIVMQITQKLDVTKKTNYSFEISAPKLAN